MTVGDNFKDYKNIKDIWTFEKKIINAKNPNWLLIEVSNQ